MADPDDKSYRKVPSARLARLAGFGQLAGGVAGNLLIEGAKRLAQGERPHLSDLLLTPANAGRVAEELSRLRGAAMKLGQMISMDGGDVLPPELTQILARLRDQAHFMPPSQLDGVMVAALGRGWRTRFQRFEMRPIAAASIGQVHRAWARDGRALAVKVQYPGVAASIDADIDNVATLLRMTGLLPRALDITPLLKEAKRQLAEEADYLREAEQMKRYGALLGGDPRYGLPAPVEDLTSRHVLAMDYVAGQPIDSLEAAPQATRDATMTALFELVLNELFRFGFMQTDPNFANYRWQPDTGRIVLLDFGAARPVPEATVRAYRRLMRAGLSEDREALRAALVEVGFVSSYVIERHRAGLDAMIEVMIAHLNRRGPFDLADRGFVERIRGHAQTIAADKTAWHLPPADTLFVQRKVSGTALLGMRMRARIPLRDMVETVLAQTAEGRD
jgi:predicted unusual protein kinase regulating ubiquinone biosynthesis (AarF/ABC1/UbiB family)